MSKHFLSIPVFFILAANPAYANEIETNQWGSATNGVRLSISMTNREPVNIGDPVSLTYRIKTAPTP